MILLLVGPSNDMSVTYVGLEALDLPVGRVEAHHLRVAPTSPRQGNPAEPYHYWFAADAGLRHVMVQYEGQDGITYKLRSVERRAYWKR